MLILCAAEDFKTKNIIEKNYIMASKNPEEDVELGGGETEPLNKNDEETGKKDFWDRLIC